MNPVTARRRLLAPLVLALLAGLLRPACAASVSAADFNATVYAANALSRTDMTAAHADIAVLLLSKLAQQNPGMSPGDAQPLIQKAQDAADSFLASRLPFDRSGVNYQAPAFFGDQFSAVLDAAGKAAGIDLKGGYESWKSQDASQSQSTPERQLDQFYSDSTTKVQQYLGDQVKGLVQQVSGSSNIAQYADQLLRPVFNAGVQDAATAILQSNPGTFAAQTVHSILGAVQGDGSYAPSDQQFNTTTQTSFADANAAVDRAQGDAQVMAGMGDPGADPAQSPAMQQASQDLGAINAGSYVLSSAAKALGKPKLAHQIQVVAGATLKIELGIASIYSGNVIGGITGIIGGVGDVFGLFGGGGSMPDPNQNVLDAVSGVLNAVSGVSDQVKKLSDKVDALQSSVDSLGRTMNARFDQVDQKLNTIYSAMTDNFKQINFQLGTINTKLDNILTSLAAIQASLDGLRTDVHQLDTALHQLAQDQYLQPLDQGLVDDIGYKARTSAADWFGFDTAEGLFYAWATDFAHRSPVAPTDQPTDDDHDGDALLDASGNLLPLDNRINYLARWIEQRLPGVPSFAPGTAGSPLPNPRVWATSAEALLKLSAEWPEKMNDQYRSRLSQAADEGARLESGIERITTGSDGKANRQLWDQLIGNYRGSVYRETAAVYSQDNAGIARYSYWVDSSRAVLKAFASIGMSQSVINDPALRSLLFGNDSIYTGSGIRVLPGATGPDVVRLQYPLGIKNGRFDGGSLAGWTNVSIGAGGMGVIAQGHTVSAIPGAERIDFHTAGGAGNTIVLSDRDPGTWGCAISDPFLVNSANIGFWTLSESSQVDPEFLWLPADQVATQPSSVYNSAGLRVVNLTQVSFPTQDTEAAALWYHQIQPIAFYDVSDPRRETPVRLVVRQHTLGAGSAYFTYFTSFDAGPYFDVDIMGSMDKRMSLLRAEISRVLDRVDAYNAQASTKGASGREYPERNATIDDLVQRLRAAAIAPIVTPPSTGLHFVSGPAVTATTTSTVTIAFQTDAPAIGKVNYGPTASYGSSQAETAASTTHSVTLTGLAPGTTYHLQVVATPSSGSAPVTAPDVTAQTATVALPSLQVTPTSATVPAGQTQMLTLTPAGVPVTWSVDGGSANGTVQNGLYQAPAAITMPLTVQVRATATDGSGRTASATIAVTSAPTTVGGTVTLTVDSSAPQVGDTVTVTANAGADLVNILSADLTLGYDPKVFTPATGAGGPALAGSLFAGSALVNADTMMTGVVRIGVVGSLAANGPGGLASIKLTVNAGASGPTQLTLTQANVFDLNGALLPVAHLNGVTLTVAPHLCGDLNGDGKLNVPDAALALRIAIGLIMPTPAQTAAACGRGINVGFASQVLRAAIGLSAGPQPAN